MCKKRKLAGFRIRMGQLAAIDAEPILLQPDNNRDRLAERVHDQENSEAALSAKL